MAIELSWYMSCDGDSDHLGQKFADFPPSYETFTRIAVNAEKSGFTAILVPSSQVSGHFGPQAPTWDSLINAAVIAPKTKTIKMIVALRPGIIEPAISARILASLDELSRGRILYNVITGGTALSSYGENLEHDDRYERTEEFIRVVDGLWKEEKFSFKGKFYELNDASVYPHPFQKSGIPILVAGSSEIAQDIAIRRASHYVFWGQDPVQISERVQHMKRKEEDFGRSKELKFITRFQIYARKTEEEAFDAAYEVLSQIDSDVLAHRGKMISGLQSKGTKEQQALYENDMLGPNLWTGMSRIRSGSAVAIVGSYEQCAKKIIEIEKAGVNLLILSGFPLHSECEVVGNHVIPLVREMEEKMGLISEKDNDFLKYAEI